MIPNTFCSCFIHELSDDGVPWSSTHAALASSASTVFNRDLKLLQRERAALSPHLAQYSYLRDEIAERLMDRLEDVHESYSFTDAVDLCAGTGHIRRARRPWRRRAPA